MTFKGYFNTRKAMPIPEAAALLGYHESDFESDDEVIVFDEDAGWVSRCGEFYHTVIGSNSWRSPCLEEVARHVYFDFWVWEIRDFTVSRKHNEEFLCDIYNEWLTWQRLPKACALEIRQTHDLTPYQTRWLEGFSDTWERVVESK